ncbi:MAG: hypothetical protein WBA77_00490 [Microcoleaceae cyanobacterium]
MNDKKRNQAPPVAEINMRRRFHLNDTSIVYAIRYIEENSLNYGDVNQVIIDTFDCFYAPLGIRAYGDPDAALRTAMKSISILQSHISYLMKLWELSSMTVNNISYITPTNLSQNLAMNTNHQGDFNGNHNAFSEGHQVENGLTFEEQQALAIYQSFNQ